MPATQYFKGTATAVPQVTQKNVASSTSSHTFIITLAYEDGSTVAVLTHTVDGVDAGNTTTIAAEIVAEFNALTHELATPITASNSTSKLILTADTAGRPFTVTYSGTGTWDNTGVANIASAGPGDWNTASNWSAGTVPVSTDTVILDYRMAAAILYGLGQSAVTLARFTDYASRRYAVGTATMALKIGATIAEIGMSSNDGNFGTSAFININFGTVTGTFTVHNSAAQGTGGLAPVVIGANHASNVLNVMGGTVWLSKLTPAETGLFATINVTGGVVTRGYTATCVANNNYGGTLIAEQVASNQTFTVTGGTTILNGTAAVGTLNVNGGQTYVNTRVAGVDEIGVLVMDGGTVSFKNDLTAFSVDSMTIKSGGRIEMSYPGQATFDAIVFSATTDSNLQFTFEP